MSQLESGLGGRRVVLPVHVVGAPTPLPETATQTPTPIPVTRFSNPLLPSPGLPLLPLQFSSLQHLDLRVTDVLERARTVDGLKDSTLAWIRKAYRSYRTYLVETQGETIFLGGDLRLQMRLLEGWIAWLRAREVSRVGINTYWRGLRLLFRWLQQQDGTANPLLYIPTPRFGRLLPRCLPRSAAETILLFVRNYAWETALERTRNLAIVGLMLMAGLRRMEVVTLQYGDVNLDDATIQVRGGKGRFGGKDRVCYAPPQLVEVLRAYMAERRKAGRSHPEFITALRANHGVSPEPIRRMFERISKATGIRVSSHRLRHTYATLLRMSNVSDRVAMELLGHSSYAMLQRYSHVFTGEHRTEAAKLRFDVLA
jgi:integrase